MVYFYWICRMVGKYSTGIPLLAIQNEAYWIKIVDNSSRALQV